MRAADRAGDKDKANALKKKLPMFNFMAGNIKETTNDKGKTDTWRKQEAVTLNGLFMLDVDDLEDPRKTLVEVEERTGRKLSQICSDLGIVLVHVTPKGRGLRFVAEADPERGNLSDNQHWLANYLGLTCDEACKDSSRGSFTVTNDDILYMNNELYDYNNEEYDKKFGDAYRAGDSRSTAARSNGRAAARRGSDGTDGETVASVEQETSAAAGADDVDLERNENGEYTFKGIPFKEIIEEKPLDLPNDGQALLQPIHVVELARSFYLALEHPCSVGQIYNITLDHALPLNRYLEVTAAVFDKKPVINYMSVDAILAKYGKSISENGLRFLATHMCFTNAKARRELGFQPTHTTEEAITETAIWTHNRQG